PGGSERPGPPRRAGRAERRPVGADLPYSPTVEGGRYLAVVADLYARMMVGGAMEESMTSRPVVDGLAMAIRRRVPAEGSVAHSDRGRRYAREHSHDVRREHGIVCCVSGVAQCWDNAPVQSVVATLT